MFSRLQPKRWCLIASLALTLCACGPRGMLDRASYTVVLRNGTDVPLTVQLWRGGRGEPTTRDLAAEGGEVPLVIEPGASLSVQVLEDEEVVEAFSGEQRVYCGSFRAGRLSTPSAGAPRAAWFTRQLTLEVEDGQCRPRSFP